MTSLDARIIEIMSRTAMVPKSEFTPDRKLALLGIGSLEQIECLLSLEDALEIELNERDLQRLQTVQDVLDAVHRACNARTTAEP